MFRNVFENRAVYEIMWENIVVPDRLQMAMRTMRIACSIRKATNTHSEYVTLNAFVTATLVARTCHELRYTYIACLVNFMCKRFDSQLL